MNRGEGPSEPSYDMALVAREHSAAIRGSAAEHLHVLGEILRVIRIEANVIEACAVLTIGMRNPRECLEATDGSGPRAEFVSGPDFYPQFTNLGVYSRTAQSSVTEFMHDEVHQVGP